MSEFITLNILIILDSQRVECTANSFEKSIDQRNSQFSSSVVTLCRWPLLSIELEFSGWSQRCLNLSRICPFWTDLSHPRHWSVDRPIETLSKKSSEWQNSKQLLAFWTLQLWIQIKSKRFSVCFYSYLNIIFEL